MIRWLSSRAGGRNQRQTTKSSELQSTARQVKCGSDGRATQVICACDTLCNAGSDARKLRGAASLYVPKLVLRSFPCQETPHAGHGGGCGRNFQTLPGGPNSQRRPLCSILLGTFPFSTTVCCAKGWLLQRRIMSQHKYNDRADHRR